MDPLARLREAEARGVIPAPLSRRILRALKKVESGVARVERAAGVRYPGHYIQPYLTVTTSQLEAGEMGVLYSRTIPYFDGGSLEILVELSAPLILFAREPTVHAVLTHEFMHYAELVRRFARLEVTSQGAPSTLYEATYADEGALHDPTMILKDKRLIRLLKSRFVDGLVDQELQSKTVRMWLEKNLPIQRLSPEANITRVPMEAILSATFDPVLTRKMEEIEVHQHGRT